MFDCRDEVINIVFVGAFDSKIINNEGGGDVSGSVVEEARHDVEDEVDQG